MLKKILMINCAALFTLLITQPANAQQEVVVYTSLDQVFSEPILKQFERETGIKTKILYDVEATKTTGLVNRLIAEKDNPQADVFWNSEIVRTILLKNKGVLHPYVSPMANNIPATFKDDEGYWTGFAARARVLIYNSQLLKGKDLPDSIFDLTKKSWDGKFALAYPLFGTTSTHAACLFTYLGDEKATEYYEQLRQNNVIIVDGNSTSRDRVQEGELSVGFTDTDDAAIAILNNKPVGIIYPDQAEGQCGALLIPNTAAMVKGAPHPEEAKLLIDYLLRPQTESRLAFMPGAQIPLRPDVERPEHVKGYDDLNVMAVDFEEAAKKIEEVSAILQEIFIR